MGKARSDGLALRERNKAAAPVALEAIALADRMGTLSAIVKVIETGTAPTRFSTFLSAW
ncbi:MAG: hypothetical protein MO846_00675 [Candidatus Devosia symbiotica]|nr:hypothetical protein [Candidatus Devosia symbiotica]